MQILLDLIRSLARCPHGKMPGEPCEGWTGPGMFDGGCLGGSSLGNPRLASASPEHLGTDVHGHRITLSDIAHAAGVEHRTLYVTHRSDGLRWYPNVDGPDGSSATLKDALDEAAEYHRAHGDHASAIEIRLCAWVRGSMEVQHWPAEGRTA